MTLINIQDFEMTKGNKLSLKSDILRAGLTRLKNKGLITEEENEKVVDPLELILEMYEITKMKDKRFGNSNARKK